MIIEYGSFKPIIHKSAFLAANAVVIGRCTLNEDCGVWFNAVIRADVNEVIIEKGTNIQDGCVIHCDEDYPVHIGTNVTVGHNAIVHGCTISDNCIVGMGSTILDGAVIGKNVIIGANSLITQGKSIPDNSLVIGSPAKVVRTLTEEEIKNIAKSAEHYVHLMNQYRTSS